MKNAINWFDIPVKDFQRAKTFYEAILGSEMETFSMEEIGMTMAFFPADYENGIGGGIAFGPGYEPSDKGTLVYLNGGEDLAKPLSRVEKAGGTILVPKTEMGPKRFMAQFMDSEGNRIALHSKN